MVLEAKSLIWASAFLVCSPSFANDCAQVEAIAAGPMFACTEIEAKRIEPLMDNMHDAGWLVARGRCLQQTEQLAQAIQECRGLSFEDAKEIAIRDAASVTMEKVYLYRLARKN